MAALHSVPIWLEKCCEIHTQTTALYFIYFLFWESYCATRHTVALMLLLYIMRTFLLFIIPFLLPFLHISPRSRKKHTYSHYLGPGRNTHGEKLSIKSVRIGETEEHIYECVYSPVPCGAVGFGHHLVYLIFEIITRLMAFYIPHTASHRIAQYLFAFCQPASQPFCENFALTLC